MGCWFVVGVLVVLEVLGLAWPGPAARRGRHRSGVASARRAMRSWPGPRRDA